MRWLLPLVPGIVLCAPAYAGVIRVPAPPIPADGVTASVVSLYIDGGATKVKVKADTGKVGAVEVSSDGLVRVSFTPPELTAPQDLTLKVTVAGEEISVAVPTVPTAKGSLEVSLEPTAVNTTTTALVRIRPLGSSPLPNDARNFTLLASVGTVDPPVPAGDGTWVARYTPPKGLTEPVLVGIAAVDLAAPDKVIGFSTLAITAKRSLSFTVQPGSSNVLTVGDKQYGPFVASPAGKVAFDVEVSPLAPKGRLVSVNPDTSKTDTEQLLPVTIAPQALIFPLATTLPVEGRTTVSVMVLDPTGTLKDVIPTLAVSKGTLSQLEQQSQSIPSGRLYQASLTAADTTGEVVLTVSFGSAKAERKIKVLSGIPTVTLTSTPSVLDSKTTTFTVTALVKDARGTALPGRVPTVTAEGATPTGTPKDNKDGTYTFAFKRNPSATEVRFLAVPPVDVSTGVPVRLLIWPSAPAVKHAGAVTVSVMAVDAYGMPVPNATLKLGVPIGDGSLPPQIVTDARGVGRVTYKAGSATGLVSLRVEGKGLKSEAALFQSPEGAGAFPEGGGDEAIALLDRWQAACPVLVISPPPPEVAVATTPASGTSTAPGTGTVVSSASEPAEATRAPGSSAPGSNKTTGPATPTEASVRRFRATFSLTNTRGSFDQDTNGGDGLVGKVGYGTPAMGFLGADLGARWWAIDKSWGRLGPEAKANVVWEWVNVLDTRRINLPLEAMVGARYGYGLGIASFEAGLGVAYTSFPVFQYTDDTLTEADLINLGQFGAQLGLGAAIELSKFRIGLDFSETFVPFPVVTNLTLGADYSLNDPLTLHVGGTFDARHAELAAGESGEGELTQKRWGIEIGAGVAF